MVLEPVSLHGIRQATRAAGMENTAATVGRETVKPPTSQSQEPAA